MRKFLFITLLLLFCQTAVATLATASAKDICSAEQLTKARKDFLDRFRAGNYTEANDILEQKYTACPELSETFVRKKNNKTLERQPSDSIRFSFMHDLLLSRLLTEKYEEGLQIGDLLLNCNAIQPPKEISLVMRLLLTECRKYTSSQCSDDDKHNSEFWNIQPEALCRLTTQIVQAVKDRDLPALRKHIRGELRYPPRNRFMEGKTFSQVFPENFRNDIIKQGPTSVMHSWRGITMGDWSLVLYPVPDDEFPYEFMPNDRFWIRSIQSKPEKFYRDDMPTGWFIDGKLLTPDRLMKPLITNDNYEDIAQQFSLKNIEDFTRYPGKYLHKLPMSIHSSRNVKNDYSLLRPADPTPEFEQRETYDNTVCFQRILDDIRDRQEYELKAEVPTNLCQSLAPSFTGNCLQSYLIETGEETGGTIGTIIMQTIYGLFQMPDGTKLVAPLVNFTGDSDARNYLEDHNVAPTELRNDPA